VTLIVGIRCSNGAVIGSDSAATFGALGQQTIQQPTSKIHVIGGSMILGVSGPIGLSQRIEAELIRLHDSNAFSGKSPVEIGVLVRGDLWSNVLEREFKIAAVAQSVVNQVALQSVLCSALLAVPVGDHAEIITFDQQGTPELASDDLPFATIGIGQQIADPFLAFLKRVFWPGRPPTLSEGKFAAQWTLQHATDIHPGGVAKPISIYQLAKQEGTWTPRRLDDRDQEEHKQAISAAEAHLRDFWKGATSSDDTDRAGPPTPPI
jgi:hypothetical protein